MSEIPNEVDKPVDAEEEQPSPPVVDPPDLDPYDDEPGHEGGGRRSRLGRLARRLMNTQDLGEDAREVLGAVWETSDRAKSEVVRMVAREVRTYLEALKLKEEVMDLVRSHSLEFHVSMNLKPLENALADLEDTPDRDDTEEAGEE